MEVKKKNQKRILASSITKSEFTEIALATRQVLHLQPILQEIGFSNISRATILYGDNQPAIASVGNDSAKSRTKHSDVRLKFGEEMVD